MKCRAIKSNNYSAKWLFDKIRYMGKLFELDDTSSSEYMEFQDVLDTYDFDNKTHLFDTATTMERVNIFSIDSMNGFSKSLD